MRVLMSTWGWRSHFHCLAPLGWALQAAGHEVRVASHPSMAEAISSAGLAAVPLGRDLSFADVFAGRIGRVGQLDADAQDDDDVLEPTISPDGGVVRLADAMLGELVEFGMDWRPDVMVWEPFNLAAAVASAALGVPGVQHLWGPDSSVTLRLDPETVIGPFARRFGLTAHDVRLTGDVLLDPAPPPTQVPLPGPSLPIRFVPYNGTAILPEWLRVPAERPRICVTAGTMMAGAGLAERGAASAAAVTAAAGLDVEVVVVVEPALRRGLRWSPGNVRVAETPLALRLLLPTCAAVVHQGGAGTMMTALACGVPQLVLPQVSDQHFNAERLELSGAGTWLDAEQADVGVIRDTLRALIADGPARQAAAKMADLVRAMPPPSKAVAQLEALVHQSLHLP